MFGVSYRPFKGMLGGGGVRNRRQTFTAAYNAAQSTLTASGKAYPRSIPTDATITVSAGGEYSLDGGAWTSTAGVWGTSRYIQIRGLSHADYGSAKIYTVTIGALDLDFTIWTMDEPGMVFPYTFPFELG
jgi:hypothetical protein